MIILLEMTPKHFYREDQDLHLINTWSFINELQMNYLENLYYNKNILYFKFHHWITLSFLLGATV
jgi:hypothetical protein